MDNYKHLGIIFDEKNLFTVIFEPLAKGAGRALGSVISIIHSLKDVGFNAFGKLYNSCIEPVLEHGASNWGFKKFQNIDNIQHRVL